LGGEAAADETAMEWDEETRQILLETFAAEAVDLLDRLDLGVERLVLEPGAQSDTVNELFRAAHTLKGSAAAVGCREVSQAAHLLEDRFEARRGPDPRVDPTLAMVWSEAVLALRQLVAARTPAEMAAALGRVHGLLETGVVPAGPSAPAAPAAALVPVAAAQVTVERRTADERRGGGRRALDDRLIRVDAERLDLLLRAGGEVVFRRTFIERRAEEIAGLVKDLGRSYQGLRTAIGDLRNQPGMEVQTQRLSELQVEFADEVANFERAVSSLREETEGLRRDVQYLQDGTTKLRTMSVSTLFTRLRRAVRDIAREEGKQVALETEGDTTEIDRVVAEKLAEPMIHVIRNAVAHGIEAPAARQAAGKPAVGRVTLSAREEGTFVIIEVADDGRGIDVPAIREALIARGLMPAEDARAAPEDEVTAAIFLPGLSTRRSADAVAGRGVGLDVVRDSVLKLGGEVTVRSEPGRGSRFTLRLPLSTAITNALLFKVGGEVLCIPVRWVVETRYLRPEDVAEERGRDVACIRGRRIPLLRLPSVLDVDSRLIGPYLPVVVLRHEGVEFAVQVDKLVGPREIVVRELGPVLAPLALYDAATISGAGKVQFVVNVATLHQLVSLQRGLRVYARPTAADPVRRVLVVDDSRSIREVVSRMLVAEGFGVDLAVDGWDAWERMSATRVDLLLTDLEMPRMDGYALIDKVRRSTEYAALPILVLSSRTGEENQVRARKLGANGFLAKPVNRRVILARLRELLRA
jgi:chemotaxis protein histidine kinase CheA